MKRTVLALGLCMVAGIAHAQEGVLYCTIDYDTGYNGKGTSYAPAKFKPSRFSLKLDGKRLLVSIGGETETFQCNTVYEDRSNLTCADATGKHFNFNPSNGRFVRLEGFGYVFGDGDSVSTSIGTCSGF